jgi:hypothetical protein
VGTAGTFGTFIVSPGGSGTPYIIPAGRYLCATPSALGGTPRVTVELFDGDTWLGGEAVGFGGGLVESDGVSFRFNPMITYETNIPYRKLY